MFANYTLYKRQIQTVSITLGCVHESKSIRKGGSDLTNNLKYLPTSATLPSMFWCRISVSIYDIN